MSKKNIIFLLKTALWINVAGWGISIIGLISPSDNVFRWLKYMGSDFDFSPKLDYWLRMSAFVFCWVAALNVRAVLDYKNQQELIYWLSGLYICGGIILASTGITLHIPINECLQDVAFCLTTGLVIGIGNYKIHHLDKFKLAS